MFVRVKEKDGANALYVVHLTEGRSGEWMDGGQARREATEESLFTETFGDRNKKRSDRYMIK